MPNQSDTASPQAFVRAFIGSDAHPHWLTKLALLHIFVPDASSGPQVRSSMDLHALSAHATSSRTYSRSEIIGAWARVGEAARLAGDECAWRAVAAALTSRPVARLEKTWRRVDPAALALVEGWVARGDADAIYQCRTPWGGDVCDRVREELTKAKRGEEGEEMWALQPIGVAREAFEAFRTSYALCPRIESGNESVDEIEEGEDCSEAIERLAKIWRMLSASGGGVGNIASQFIHIDQFMSLSVAAETRRNGQYEPLFWARAASSSGPTLLSLVPLLFPPHLPHITFLDRSQILRGRVDSAANQLNIQDAQFVRRPDGILRPSDTHRHNVTPESNYAFLRTHDFGGTVVTLFEGELKLLVQPGNDVPPSRPASRPPSGPPSSFDHGSLERAMSRTPSMRVRAGQTGVLDRKPSLARRNSLPSISQRTSLVVPEQPSDLTVRVIVLAGSLDRLVDLLAHGLPDVVVSIADDNGEMPLRDRRVRDLKLDKTEFANVWWNVFRSFVSPLVFFELLRKRYVSTASASPLASDLIAVAVKRTEIIEVLFSWLQNGGAQDVLNDGALYQAIQSFVHSPTEHELPSLPDKEAMEMLVTLQQRLKAFSDLFRLQTRRPTDLSVNLVNVVVNTSSYSGTNVHPPNLDRMSAEELVNMIDAMALAGMRNITEEDLFITADLLEVQAADRLGWFLPWDPSSTAEDVEIQTIYSHLREVMPTSMVELGHDELYRLFPPAVRSGLRAHHVLRKWLISQIVAPRLGLQVRQARIELLLQAVELCRIRGGPELSAPAPVERRSARSFAEYVITSAILSPESRAHVRAWLNVAGARNVSSDSVFSYLAKPFQTTMSSISNRHLAVDLGWLLERMLEVLSLPDTYEPAAEVGRMINFDKRRQLCHLVVGVQSRTRTRYSRRRDVSRDDLERLNLIEQEFADINLDMRAIRDEAMRESNSASNQTPTRRNVRPFQKVVMAQHEKNKRDRMLRERLSKERKQEQLRMDKRDEYYTRATSVQSRRQYTPAQRQHRTKKSGSVTFLQQLIRPISSAFSLDSVDTLGDRRTAAELDFVASGKPALVLNVADARVSPYQNYNRSYTFQLDTEDGGHYLLQAATKAEMAKWIEMLRRVSKAAAQRRLTYLGNSPKSRIEDHIHDRPTAAPRGPNAVFGVNLDILIKREHPDGHVPPGTVPAFIERCLQEVEMRGLFEVGIYRIAGANSEVNQLRDQLNRGHWPVTASTDIYAVCDLIKSWFRVLPEPVFPSYSYHDIVNAMKIEDFEARIARIRVVIHALPRINFDLLRRIVEHLDRVTDYEEHNQMTPDALAIVFSPNLMRAPDNDFLMIMANMPYSNKLVKTLISNFHTIFDAVDVDQEGESEEEDGFVEESIPEEDEDAEIGTPTKTPPRLSATPEPIPDH